MKEVSNIKGFTKECTLIAKGIFILLLLFHHVFYGDTIYEKQIVTHILSQGTVQSIAMWSKICVGGFTFLSAYGMTYKIMQAPENKGLLCIQRLISFVSNCIFVYCIAVVYRRFVVIQGIKEIYLDNKGSFNPVYMVVDALGLADLFSTPCINVTWWYCSFAILLIIAIPGLYVLYENGGWYLAGLALLVSVDPLVVSAILGVAFAKGGWFIKLAAWIEEKRINKLIVGMICVVLLACSYSFFNSSGSKEINQFYSGIIIAVLSMIVLRDIPIISTILKLLGKYSMFMFLTHTFVYYYFYEDFVYSFTDAIRIYFVLLIISFGLSVSLTKIRKIIGYDYAVKKILEKIEVVYFKKNIKNHNV